MGKQKTKQPPKKVEGPQEPKVAPKTAIQLTPSQLSDRLSAAQADTELERALKNVLNYANSISLPMKSEEEFKGARKLLENLVILSWAQDQKEVPNKLLDECIQRLSDVVGEEPEALEVVDEKHPEGMGPQEERDIAFHQFGFFGLADIAGRGSVAFGNLPTQMDQQIDPSDRDRALDALNKLANAFYGGGNMQKAGRDYLKFLENLFGSYGFNADQVNSAINNFLSETPGLGQEIQDALRNGTYGSYFGNGDASFNAWEQSGENNYLVWTYKEIELVFSAEVKKYLFKRDKGRVRGEVGVGVSGAAYKETERSVRAGEPGLYDREEKSKHLGGGGGEVYGEIESGRWKGGASIGAQYIPGEQGGWFIPVSAFGQVTGSTDEMSQTLRIQVKASPEVTREVLNLEGGAMLNGLFFKKKESDTAVGYLFGVKAIRMSTTDDGITNVDLVIEGQLGPTFQKIFAEKGALFWVGLAGIVQQEIPQGRGVEGPLPQQTKVGAGLEVGAEGKKVSGFLQIRLNPITVTKDSPDFVGRDEFGRWNGVTVTAGFKF